MKKTLVSIASFCLSLWALNVHAAGDPVLGEQKTATCAGCHGSDGNSTNPIWPKLAGQHEDYLYKQLTEYKNGERKNAVMAGMVATLSDADMQNLAAFYASQSITAGQGNPEQAARGKKLYFSGDAESGVPACAACHGANGEGNKPAGFPALAGQHAAYTVATLKAFRDGTRANDANAMMRLAVKDMTDAEMQAVAEYLVGLK